MNEIINDDFFKISNNFENNSVDLILTDPPYEIEYKNGLSNAPFKMMVNDVKGSIDWEKFFNETYRILKYNKTMYVHCRTDMIINISKFVCESQFKYSHDFIWFKGDMGYGNLNIMGTTHELILALSKGKEEKSRKIIIDNKIKKRTPANYFGKLSKKEYYGHPTQKPVGLLMYLILNRTDKNDIIFDPFCGVGSTIIASKILNRQYIGIEIDEEFYKKSINRLSDSNHLQMYINMYNNGLKFKNSCVSYDKI